MAEWKEETYKLLTKLNSRKDSEFFREPVPWQSMGLFDYPKIIKQPMDLHTVRQKMDRGQYNNPLEAASDIRLIFINAMTYNAPGSRVYLFAKSLSDFWEANCSSILKNEEDLDKPASIEEMTHWVDKCHRISADDLGKVLKLIDSLSPNSLVKRPDTNEVEVNVDLITGKAFREASALVSTILPDIILQSSRRSAIAKSTSQQSNNAVNT